jgi:hypothetical protein
VATIVNMAIEAVQRTSLPIPPSRPAIEEIVRAVVGNPRHFAMVTEIDCEVVAACGAVVHHGAWFERLQADVVMFYTRQPGCGVPLLREFARWVRGRPAIKMALFSIEPNADRRIIALLGRLGFSVQFPQVGYVRGLT